MGALGPSSYSVAGPATLALAPVRIKNETLCLPPSPIDIRSLAGHGFHLFSRKELVKLNMRVSEEHLHPVLAFVVMPDVSGFGHITIRVPDPIALDDLVRRTPAHFALFDRGVFWVIPNPANLLNGIIITAELRQVTVPIL